MSSQDVNQSNLVDRAMSAFRWVAALRFLGQLISWLSTIFVIRFLAPEDYGVISLAEVFRTLLVLFSTMGLSQGLMKIDKLEPALIRKTLGLLIIVNGILFLVQFCFAAEIARFYDNEDLELVLKVLAFTYLLIPWTSVPSSLVARNLDHKKTSKITFFSSVLASALSLFLAYLGYGYWALIAAILFTAVFNCFWFNLLIDYPRLPSFVFKNTGVLFKFGAFVAMSDLLFVAYNKVDVALAGMFFDISQIGLYGVAIQLATMLMTKSVPLFNVVAFPAFARMNALSGDSNEYLITTLRFASALIFPMFLGVAMVAQDLIGLVLGSSWIEISGLFVIIVLSVPFRVLAYVISPAVLAAGAASVNMTNSLITTIFIIAAVLLMQPFGLPGVALAWSLSSICIFLLTLIRGGHLLRIPLPALCGTFIPALVASLVMCAVIYTVDLQIGGTSGVHALYKIPFGALVYAAFFWYVFRGRSEELKRILFRLAGRN